MKAIGLVMLVMTAGLMSADTLADGNSESGYARLALDGRGAVRSLCETKGGRELVAAPRPMVVTVGKDGRRTVSDAVKLSVERFHGGWTFRVEKADLKDVATVELCRLRPTCAKYCGTLVNGLSDDRSGVVLRAYDVETKMRVTADELWLEMRGDEDLVGRRFGLSAGSREEIPQMLRGMTLAAGLAHSDTGTWEEMNKKIEDLK